MRHLTLITAALVAVLAAGAYAQNTRWFTDADKAAKAARKSGKPILADFTGSDWCVWCIRLKKEVFNTPAFKKWAEKNVILLEVDFPRSGPQPRKIRKQNRALQAKYAVRGFPTVVFLDGEGKELGRTGYQRGGARAWIAAADRHLGGSREKGTGVPGD